MIDHLTTSEAVSRIGWTILHSLWQVLIIGLLTGIALKLTSRRSAVARYRIGCLGMAAMFVPLIITFALFSSESENRVAPSIRNAPHTTVQQDQRPDDVTASLAGENWNANTIVPETTLSKVEASTSSSDSGLTLVSSTPASTSHEPASGFLFWIVVPWAVGVCLFSFWNVGGWCLVQRLRTKAAVPAAAELQRRLDELAERLRISRPIRLLESLLIRVPLTIGWLRPVVLLPMSLATTLTAAELDAVLAHELAHVRRRDYLVNLLQAIAETVLFYHPVVWLLSRQVRIEREFCCDDAAVSLCGDRISYARTLATIEAGSTSSAFAMSLLGRKRNMTLERIRRILGITSARRRNWLSGVCVLALLLTAGAGVVLSQSDNGASAESAAPEDKPQATKKSTKNRDRAKPVDVAGIDARQFRLDLRYRGESGKPYYNLTLSVPPLMKLKGVPFSSAEQISVEQAKRLIAHLSATRFFKHATPYKRSSPPITSDYVLLVKSGSKHLREGLGWNLGTLRRLDGLHRVLKGEPKKAISTLIARLAGHRSIWNKGKARGGLQTKLSADQLVYGSGHPIPIRLEVRNIDGRPRTFSDPRVDYTGLSVIDERGNKVPHLRGPSQLQQSRITIEPGKSLTLAAFDLASHYYLRRPGRYTIQSRDGDLPASNKLLLVVKPTPSGTQDGDPVGRILPLLGTGWTISADPNFKGRVRPGSNRGKVPGHRIFLTHTPTGTRRDLALVWIWVTTKPAPKAVADPERSDLPPPSEYLGEIAKRHVYLHASTLAIKRWPGIRKDVRRALSGMPTVASGKAVSRDDRYRAYHDRYKSVILKAASAGRRDDVEKLTARFNKSIDSRLLFVQLVNRKGPIAGHKIVFSKFYGHRKITIGKLGYTYSKKPIVSHSASDGYTVIATNPLKSNEWPDDLQVTMVVANNEKAGAIKPKSDDGFGKESRFTPGLRLKIYTAKKKYRVGENIEVIFTLKNISKKEMVIVDADGKHRSDFHKFEFSTVGGKRIAQVAPVEPSNGRTYVRKRLPPGKTVQHKVALNSWKLAGLGRPYNNIGQEARTIVVTGIYATPKGLDLKIENGWGGIIQSRPLQIEIFKPKAKNTTGKKASDLRPVSEAARQRALNHCNAADNLQRRKRHDAAISEYGKAIEIDPLCTRAYFGRSSLYASHKKDYRAAVRDLTQLLMIKPEDFSARYNRGLYRESLRKYDDAIRDYTVLLDEDIDFSHLVGPKKRYLALAHHYRGRAYQWYKKEYAKAAADFTKALEYDPNLRMLHYRRGQCYHELGKYKESVVDFDAALQKQPKYPNLLLSYAWLLATCPDAKYRNGRKAIQLAEQVAPLSRARSSRLLDVLAAAYAESGQLKQAVAAAKKALVNSNQKHGPPRKEIEARLKLYRAGKPFHLKARSGKQTRIDK